MDVIKLYRNIINGLEFKRFKSFSIGDISSFVIIYVSSFLLNKYFSATELGAFSYYNNILLLLYPIFSLNIYQIYIRFYNKVDDFKLVVRVKHISLIATLVMFLVTYLVWHNIQISSLSFIILYQERVFFYRASLKIKTLNFLKILNSFLLLIIIVSLVLLNHLTYLNAISAYGTSYFIISIVGLFIPNQKNNFKEGVELSTISMLKYTIPIVATVLVTWILNVSDQYVIKEIFSFKEVGEYSVANRSINVIRMVTSMFLLYWPILYFNEMSKKKFNKIKKIRIIFIIVLTIISLITIFCAHWIYIILGASKFIEFTMYFRILVIAELFRLIASILLIYRSFTLQTYYNLIFIFVVSLLNIVLNLLFIPIYGVVFAAYSTLISTSIYLLLSIIFGYIPERKFSKINE